MKYVNPAVILLSVLVLTGCSSFFGSDDDEGLGKEFNNNLVEKGEVSDLVIPPDLISPKSSEKINNTGSNEKVPVLVAKTNKGYATLVFPKSATETWDYLGWALDELGVDIVDSDRFERSYYVNFVRESVDGFLWKLVGKGDDKISIQLVVRGLDEGRSQVFFNDLGEENEQKTIDFSIVFFEEVANQF